MLMQCLGAISFTVLGSWSILRSTKQRNRLRTCTYRELRGLQRQIDIYGLLTLGALTLCALLPFGFGAPAALSILGVYFYKG